MSSSQEPKPMQLPDLNAFMDKRVQVKVRGGRLVSGTLRGVDAHMNLVLKDALDESRRPGVTPAEGAAPIPLGEAVIRGNVVMELVGLAAA
mmetsp:Transcript_72390/g.84093  ORF Transcript_72390/g.84093 Transcript_72390/m.84093 type:complete len:91 (-) Transcript_72390:98-370(-)